MDEVLRIERASFEKPWTEEEFLCCLRQRNCIGGVVEDVSCDVRGFMIYELHRSTLRILNLAVDPSCRGLGYGRMMVERLINKLHQQRRREIVLEIRKRISTPIYSFSTWGFGVSTCCEITTTTRTKTHTIFGMCCRCVCRTGPRFCRGVLGR